jgi:hypothetical protein
MPRSETIINGNDHQTVPMPPVQGSMSPMPPFVAYSANFTWRSDAAVTAVMHNCAMLLHRAFESPLIQLTVNQAAGVAVNDQPTYAGYLVVRLPTPAGCL